MARTDRYRQQHNEIVELLQNLERQLNAADLSKDASAARKTLSVLAGKLALHLSSEDQLLYPEIKSSSDPELKRIAAEFERDMLPLSASFKAYLARWPTPTSITQDAAGFVTQTRAIIRALMERIKRENSVFYAAYDSLR